MLRATALLLILSHSLLIATSLAETALPRQLAFYIVHPSPSSSGSDGRLPQSAWDAAPVASTYYEYWKQDPGPGRLQTELQLLYSERGIHLKITNFETDGSPIKAKVVRKDDPELWKDASAQIYFDPEAKGIGYVNFTVNQLGTQADMKRMDAAVTLPEWSGHEWSATVSTEKNSWTIEAFFPWSDLGKKASPGDIWMFNHVRFSWQDEKLTATTWAAGGNYANAKLFGYLYFAGPGAVSNDHLAQLLSKAAAPPWMAPAGDNILISAGQEDVRSLPAKKFIASYQKEMEAALARVEALPKDIITPPESLQDLRNQAAERTKAPGESLEKLRAIIETTQQINRMYWQSKINQILDAKAAPKDRE